MDGVLNQAGRECVRPDVLFGTVGRFGDIVIQSMAIEHTCHSCAAPLGAIAATRDPQLGLCVVVCPECLTACVRRRHPLVGAWRTFCVVFWGAYAVSWRGAVGMMLALGSIVLVVVVRESLSGLQPWELLQHYLGQEDFNREVANWREEFGPQILLVYMCWFIGMGVAASGGLAHVRRRVWVWATVFGLPWMLLGLGMVIHLVERSDRGLSWQAPLFDPTFVSDTRFIAVAQMLGWVFAPLGVPLGRMLRRASARRDQRRWMRKLARARRRRHDR